MNTLPVGLTSVMDALVGPRLRARPCAPGGWKADGSGATSFQAAFDSVQVDNNVPSADGGPLADSTACLNLGPASEAVALDPGAYIWNQLPMTPRLFVDAGSRDQLQGSDQRYSFPVAAASDTEFAFASQAGAGKAETAGGADSARVAAQFFQAEVKASTIVAPVSELAFPHFVGPRGSVGPALDDAPTGQAGVPEAADGGWTHWAGSMARWSGLEPKLGPPGRFAMVPPTGETAAVAAVESAAVRLSTPPAPTVVAGSAEDPVFEGLHGTANRIPSAAAAAAKVPEAVAMPVRADTVTRWQTAAQAGATVQVDKHDPRAEPATAVSAAATLGQRAAAERAQDRRESMPSLNASQRSALAADGMQRAGFDQMPGSEPMTTTAASELLRRDARRSDADTTPAVFRQTAMGTADPSSDLSRFQVGGSVADEGWSTAARSVAEQVSYYIFQGAQRAEVSLQGPDGGLIDVRIDLRGNEASIHFGTSDPETAHMLEASGLHLKEILHRQGLALSEVSVNMSDHSGTGAGRQTGGHVPQSSGVPRRPTATDQASPIAVVVERRGSDAAVDEYV